MILYDESGTMIAIEKDTADLFGYSNLENFKKEVEDVADLFIKEEGYIYKFDNFNWIDFINYSEENKNRALIKKDENTLIEIELKAKELLSIREINDSENLYVVEVSVVEEVVKTIENEIVSEKKDNTKNQKEDDIPEINYDGVKERLEIEKSFYDELLEDFLNIIIEEVKKIPRYVEENNYELLNKKIKKLKSISSNLELKTFTPLLSSIDRGVKSKNPDNIKKFFKLLEKEVDLLSSYINIQKGL